MPAEPCCQCRGSDKEDCFGRGTEGAPTIVSDGSPSMSTATAREAARNMAGTVLEAAVGVRLRPQIKGEGGRRRGKTHKEGLKHALQRIFYHCEWSEYQKISAFPFLTAERRLMLKLFVRTPNATEQFMSSCVSSCRYPPLCNSYAKVRN